MVVDFKSVCNGCHLTLEFHLVLWDLCDVTSMYFSIPWDFILLYLNISSWNFMSLYLQILRDWWIPWGFTILYFRVTWISSNRSIPQIPQMHHPVSRNAPLCNRNVHTCVHSCVPWYSILFYLRAQTPLTDEYPELQVLQKSGVKHSEQCASWQTAGSIEIHPIEHLT